MSRRISAILYDLDAVAARVLARPFLVFGERDRLTALGVQVAEAIRRPVEDVRTIDCAAAMLVQALERLADLQDSEQIGKWLAIVAALKAKISHDSVRAVEAELRALTTADHDYIQGRR